MGATRSKAQKAGWAKSWGPWAGLLGLLGLWAYFHFQVLFLGHNFVYLDAGNFFYPLWEWGARVWRSGFLPLWDPDAAFGFPAVADPENLTWYPPKIFLYLLFPAGTAFKLLGLGHSLWLLLGFWLFARDRGAAGWPAAFGTVAFGFGFESVALLTGASALFFTFSWIPWIFLCASRLERGQRGALTWFALCAALQLAAGYPVYAYLTFLSLAGEKLWREFRSGMKLGNRAASWARMGLGLGWAFLFNLAWILPFLEMQPRSNIAGRMDLGTGLGWGHLATWLNPFFCGHPLWGAQATPFMFWSFFMGLPLVPLAVWGAAGGRRQAVAVVPFFILLALSLGDTVGLGEWLKAFVPGYHWVVRSAYWIPLACFFAARGAVGGAQRLLDEKKDRSGVWALLVGASLAAALALGVPAGLPSFWAGGLLLLAAGWRGIRPGLRGGLLLAALGCSLLPAVQSFYFTLPQSFYQAPPLRAAAVPGTRIFHAPDLLDATKTVSGSTAQQACGKPKELLMPNWPLLEGLEEAGFNNTLCLREFLRWYYAPQEAPSGSRKKFLDYLNAGLVLGWTAPPAAPRPIAGFPVPVWIDPTPLPKWFCASRARLEGGWPLDFETMAKPGYDFARDCFVADPERVGSYAPRPVEMDRPSPNGVELEVEGKGHALLVSSELAYPGWKARVAGEDRGLEVVNHSFRGLALGPGERRVALRYDPGSVRLGLFGLLLALGLWIFTAWGLLAPRKAAHGRA